MDNYEIRIVKRDQAGAVHRSEHINDHAAIRRGQILAEVGDQVEIWRGAQCVYASRKGPTTAH
jgi:DNA-binding transcriptional regulator/RsmH inhibitor MraZ